MRCSFNAVGTTGGLTGLQMAQQQQQVWSSAVWSRITAWLLLPGSCVVLEMMLRNLKPGADACHANNFTHMALISLGHWFGRTTLPLFAGMYISMVTSVHKLLLLHTDSFNGHHSLPSSVSPKVASMTLDLLTDTRAFLMTLLRSGLSPAEALNASKVFQGLVESAVSSLPPSTATSRICIRVEYKNTMGCGSDGVAKRNRISSSSSTSSRSSTTTALVSSTSNPMRFTQELHHLRAVIVMLLMRISNQQQRLMEGQPTLRARCPTNTEKRLGWLMELQSTYPGLAGVARNLLLPLDLAASDTSASSAFKREAMVWDAYAVQHFHGRLLPGCSYIGCINMEGTSEASLDTVLCSGCRRTRYCSLDCQRAAWRRGGHSEVCGKGEWAKSAE